MPIPPALACSLLDPPRPDSAETIELAKSLGVEVRPAAWEVGGLSLNGCVERMHVDAVDEMCNVHRCTVEAELGRLRRWLACWGLPACFSVTRPG